MTRIEITEETVEALDDYAGVSIAFEVNTVVDASRSTMPNTRFTLTERRLATPFVKDYDALPNNGPLAWARRFDVTHWGFLAARVNGVRAGSGAIAFRSPGIHLLEARDGLAVLWDIRVAPEMRGQGIGSALLSAAERWAARRSVTWLGVETQNINVPACRFYARHGFVLETIDVDAYPELPGEVQFLWYKPLNESRESREPRRASRD